MLNILLIDDLRDFKQVDSAHKVTVARTSRAALEILNTNESYDEIWLDHDLGLLEDGTVDSVMPVVDFLSERAFLYGNYPVGKIYVHSANPVGARAMVRSLDNYGYNVYKVDPSVYLNA